VRVIDADLLQKRAERVKYIGAIRHLRVTRRSATGRAQALEAVGTRGSVLFEGADAIQDFLSPSSLRSTLFTIQPLVKGGAYSRFILWGAGTGHGLGLCRAGAIGQASIGRGYKAILATYFPSLEVENLDPKRRPKPAPKPGTKGAASVHGRNKPKNPHFKSK
jgi:SpoIID/LytB domain protein